MVIFGPLLTVLGFGLFFWLLFTAAIYALPLYAGLLVGLATYHHGAGLFGSLLAGALTGGATLVIGQIVFTVVRAPWVRAAIATIYVIPAGVAGYYAMLGLAELSGSSPSWRVVFAIITAIIVAGMAFVRLVPSVGVAITQHR